MIEPVKLSEWARANGVSRQSATRWFHAGVLPVPARQLATGSILVDQPSGPPAGVAVDARVWSGDQWGDLDRQVARLTAVATERKLSLTQVVAEVGLLTSFCACLDGRRSARRRAEAALAAMNGSDRDLYVVSTRVANSSAVLMDTTLLPVTA